MADVTGGTPPTGSSPFDVPGDLAEAYAHFGDASMFSVANVASLPSSGNWEGRLLQAADTGILYRWHGGWKVVAGGDVAAPFRSNAPISGVTDLRVRAGLASGTTTSGGVLIHTFHTPFPTACVGVLLMQDNESGADGDGNPTLVRGSVSPTGFQTFWPRRGSGAVAIGYVAFGY